MIKPKFIFVTILLSLHIALAQNGQQITKITYDVYFKEQFLGETIAEVNPEGEATAIDTSILIEQLPRFLEKAGVLEHPVLKQKYVPQLMPIKDAEQLFNLTLKVIADRFRIEVELPSSYKIVSGLPFDNQNLDINTIAPSKNRGWFDLSGNIALYNFSQNASLASWRGGFAIDDWHVYANGIFKNDPSQILQNWRIEKSIWKDRITRFQIGWPSVPLIVNGQYISSNIFGAAISNSLNRILDSGILKELPGGIVQLGENSLVDIFTNGLLTRSVRLNAGRYNLRDLAIDPSINSVDVRVTTESGRLETTRLNLFSFPKQPAKGTIEYAFYFGLQAENQWAPALGGAIYQGFGGGLAIGLHQSWMAQDGFRLGFFLEKNAPNCRLDLGAWWQNRNLDSQLGEIDINFIFPQIALGMFSRLSLNFYNSSALPINRTVEATIGFTPKIRNIDIAQINVGLVREISQRQGYFVRISRSFILWSNFSVGLSISTDTLQNNTQAIFFLSLNPLNGFSQQYSQDLLNDQSLRYTTNIYLQREKIRFTADYSHLRTTGLNSLTVLPGWDTDIVALRANASFQEQIRGEFKPNQISLAFETGLLFADGSFAITSRPNETFAIIDASDIKYGSPLEVRLQNIRIRGFNHRYGLTGLVNFRRNAIDIDASKAGYGYAHQKEAVSPNPGQAYCLPIENKDVLVATGILHFPNQETVNLMHGKLTHTDTKESAHWYTGSEGVFAFEGKAGVWQGMVYIDNKQYHLQLNLNESDSIDGALFLGDITLKEIK